MRIGKYLSTLTKPELEEIENKANFSDEEAYTYESDGKDPYVYGSIESISDRTADREIYYSIYLHENELGIYVNEKEYKIDSDFSGYLSNPIEVVTGMHYLLNWIMDVVIDWETYKTTETRKLPDGTTQSIDISPEFEIWKNINW